MPTYKLFYFDARGRAEPARLVFAQADVKYEDIRFTREEWVSTYKQQSPFGLSPWLEVDGVKIGGSLEIARFLGEELGLAGSNKVENAQIAGISDFFTDFMKEAAKVMFVKADESQKAEMIKESRGTFPKWLDVLEKQVSADGWIFGSRPTWMDLYFYNALSFIGSVYPNLLEGYPRLSSVRSNVEKLPNIAKWIKERPETSI